MADKKQYLIIGVGCFGSPCQELEALGHEVLAVDSDEDRVAAIAPCDQRHADAGHG